jgi:hypothetical protein
MFMAAMAIGWLLCGSARCWMRNVKRRSEPGSLQRWLDDPQAPASPKLVSYRTLLRVRAETAELSN